MKKFNHQQGSILIQAIVFGSIAVLLLNTLGAWAGTNVKASRQASNRETAIQIAEAGIDYYRWHLAHAPQDYRDGTGVAGPYTHNFKDKDGNIIGQFILDITPPPLGSTLVTIKSTGKINADPSISRSATTKLAKPSLAKYSLVSNSDMRFGEGTEVFGPVHSNGGIRFDGVAHNIVSSTKTNYTDPDHTGGNEFGVHTHVNAPPGAGVNNTFRPNEAPPSATPSRTDVFLAGRQFPVPAVDFTGLVSDLSQIKTDAIANGKYYAASGGLGYYILLKTNDTFDIYRVNSLISIGGACATNATTAVQPGWGTWSINTTGGSKTLIASNVSFPANGLIFTEDNLWIDGQINTARLTIAAATFPDSAATRRSITVNNDLLYSNYGGQDVLSLIAQNNVNVGLKSLDTLRIDAAMIAQNGRIGRFYYSSNCGTGYVRDTLTLYGMLATNGRYGFAYSNNTGYTNRNLIYDANLLYGPPPSFPLTSDQYSIISWDETN